ncbi:hypothetical protein ABZX67_31350, partial [Streptomyces sp. NPDC003036]
MSGRVWVLGVDSGGSGLRVALGAVAGETGGVRAVDSVAFTEPVRTGERGIDAGHLLERLVPAAEELLTRAGVAGRSASVTAVPLAAVPLAAVAVGAAGMATLGDDLRATLPAALRSSLGVDRLALAADAVTAYAGALGQRPGAVVAAGTGRVRTVACRYSEVIARIDSACAFARPKTF